MADQFNKACEIITKHAINPEQEMLNYLNTDASQLVAAVYNHLKLLESYVLAASKDETSYKFKSECQKELRHFKESLKLRDYNRG